MADYYSLKFYEDGPHMVADPKGKWAWGTDLAAARAEIEQLTHLLDLSKKTTEAVLERAEKAEVERDSFQAMFRSCLKGNDALREKAQKANTERDEARAQVAADMAANRGSQTIAQDIRERAAMEKEQGQ